MLVETRTDPKVELTIIVEKESPSNAPETSTVVGEANFVDPKEFACNREPAGHRARVEESNTEPLGPIHEVTRLPPSVSEPIGVVQSALKVGFHRFDRSSFSPKGTVVCANRVISPRRPAGRWSLYLKPTEESSHASPRPTPKP